MSIRNMTIEDYDAVMSLWHRTDGMGLSSADSEESIRRFLDRNNGLCFVDEEDGMLVGSILCGHDGRRGYIYHTAVDVQYRGRCIGKTLVERSLCALKNTGIEKCHLFVFADNEEGQAFWAASGWKCRKDIAVYSKNIT